MAAAFLAASAMLAACVPQKNEIDTSQELPVPEIITPGASLKTKLAEAAKPGETKETAGQAFREEEPEASSGQASREGENPPGEEFPDLQIPESLSGETGEQTAVYTQAYSENGLYFVDCVRLYAEEDRLYRLEEQLELYLRYEELGMDVEPEDLEEMLDMVGELFQGIMDEYGENEGVTTELRRQENQYLMDITCEVTEETAQGIVDLGFLNVEDTSELLSFRDMCEMLEEENYTKAK